MNLRNKFGEDLHVSKTVTLPRLNRLSPSLESTPEDHGRIRGVSSSYR